MLKSLVALFAVACIASSARVDQKRFLNFGGSSGINLGGLTGGLGLNLDLNLLTNFQNTLSQLSNGLSSSLESLINGQLDHVAFIQQLVSNLNTLGTQLPNQVFSNHLINFPIDGSCVNSVFNPSGDNANTCLSQVFPQLGQCSNAIENPTVENLLTCTKLVENINQGAEACVNYVKNKDEDSFIECSKMVVNMVAPNVASLLSIYQQCKPIISGSDNYETISSCAFEVINSANSQLGSTFPVLNQITNIKPLADCVYANHQTPSSVLQNCQAQLGSIFQSFNLNNLSSLITQLTQCKTSGSSVHDCALKFISLAKSL